MTAMNRETTALEQDQITNLVELGDRLQQRREQQALSLAQVAEKTMIQRRFLKAIEEGDLYSLPEPVYVQGFLKRYGDVLGLDGAAMADAFPTELDIRTIKPSWQHLPAAQLRPVHLYALYALLVVVAIGGLNYLFKPSAPQVGRESPSPTVDAAPSPAKASPVPQTASVTTALQPTAPAPNASATPVASPSPAAGTVRVDVTFVAESWVRIKADGKTAFEGILTEGSQRTWTANSQITIRAGNAGAVKVAYNDGQATQLGAPGAVEEVTFPADQQAASLPQPQPSPQ